MSLLNQHQCVPESKAAAAAAATHKTFSLSLSSSDSGSSTADGNRSTSTSSGTTPPSSSSSSSRDAAESPFCMTDTFHGAISKVEVMADPRGAKSPCARKTSYLVFANPHQGAYFQTLREINFMRCFKIGKHCMPLMGKPYFVKASTETKAQHALSLVHHMPGWPMTLTDFIDQTPMRERVPLFRHVLGQLCLALTPLHANGMAHGDVKPHNIMFDPANGQHLLSLIDFNSTWFENRPGIRQICTATFRAPELFWYDDTLGDAAEKRFFDSHGDAGRAFGPWNDVWSAGLVLLFWVTGLTPLEDFLNPEDPENPEAASYVSAEEQLRIARYVCRSDLKRFPVAKYLHRAGLRRRLDCTTVAVDADGDINMSSGSSSGSSSSSSPAAASTTPHDGRDSAQGMRTDDDKEVVWVDSAAFDEIETLLSRMLEQEPTERITVPQLFEAIHSKPAPSAQEKQQPSDHKGDRDQEVRGQERLQWDTYNRSKFYRASELAVSQAIQRQWSDKERARRTQFLLRNCAPCLDKSWNFKSPQKDTMELAISLMDRYWVQAKQENKQTNENDSADADHDDFALDQEQVRVYSTSRLGSSAKAIWAACGILAEFILVEPPSSYEAAIVTTPMISDLVDIVECLDFDLYRPSLLSLVNCPNGAPHETKESSTAAAAAGSVKVKAWSRQRYECHNMHAAAVLAVRPEFVHWTLEEKQRQFVALRQQQVPYLLPARRVYLSKNLHKQIERLQRLSVCSKSSSLSGRLQHLKSSLEFAHDLSLFELPEFADHSRSLRIGCIVFLANSRALVGSCNKLSPPSASDAAAQELQVAQRALAILPTAMSLLWPDHVA